VTATLESPPAPEPEAPERAGRVSLAVGLALLLAGVAVLGWVGWQFWGTTWVAHRAQAQVVEQLEKQWSEQPGPGASGASGAAGGSSVRTEHGTARAIVRIPRFGADYAVPLLEGVTDDDLAAGIGHFTGTAGPGQVGNFALAAHRITHGEPFREMPSLQPGDEVVVETRTTDYTYVLDTGGSQLEVPFTQGWVLDPLPKNPRAGGVEPPQQPGERLITLTTCAELFHTDERLVAFGHLVGTAPHAP
jgi:sortase A